MTGTPFFMKPAPPKPEKHAPKAKRTGTVYVVSERGNESDSVTGVYGSLEGAKDSLPNIGEWEHHRGAMFEMWLAAGEPVIDGVATAYSIEAFEVQP